MTPRLEPIDIGRKPAYAPGQLVFRAPRRGKPPAHIVDLDLDERIAAAKEAGLPGFRARQMSVHYFQHYTTDPSEMTDLPLSAREKLAEVFFPELVRPVRPLLADGGRTVKTLWSLHDGAYVESVLMRYEKRDTLCISSQAGCGMNCPFCATGQQGLTRNLSAAEILEQVRLANRALSRGEVEGGPGRVDNIVFMGMGEPLANYKAVAATVKRLVAPPPEGFGMGARHITVSTVGLEPAIRRLTAEGIPVTLAVSLHAPDDELRDELVPINTRYPVDAVLDAARAHFEATGRRVSIEYALIRNINDHAWRAQMLADKLIARGGTGWAHVNPIPLNPVPGSTWTASDPEVEEEFVATLRAAGITTTIRDTRGSDIDGACGQLAAASREKEAHRAEREARVARVEAVSSAPTGPMGVDL